MRKHKIAVDDLKGYKTEIELAGSHGRGENKSLFAKIDIDNNRIYFTVIDNGEEICSEETLEKAVEKYNDL